MKDQKMAVEIDICNEAEQHKVRHKKTYNIVEIFYSLQGEGMMAGVPMVFVRFAHCNMKCQMEAGPQSPGGFDCDTYFAGGRAMTLEEIDELITEVCEPVGKDAIRWMLLTGGEPGLQLDFAFIEYFRHGYRLDKDPGKNWRLAVETNGTIDISHYELDWICVSPKIAEHALQQTSADEVKYVVGYGQEIPKTSVTFRDPIHRLLHKLISPATSGQDFDSKTIDWCINLVKENPTWRLTAQLHKLWR